MSDEHLVSKPFATWKTKMISETRYQALLRVARAADKMANPMPAYIQGSQYDEPIEELCEALREVEQLLAL